MASFLKIAVADNVLNLHFYTDNSLHKVMTCLQAHNKKKKEPHAYPKHIYHKYRNFCIFFCKLNNN